MVYSVRGLRLNTGFPFLLLPLSIHVDHGTSTNDYIDSRCSTTDNYTGGSGFGVNMRSNFSTLTKDAPAHGFSNATTGEGSEMIYGLVQCRGDVDADNCKTCVDNSTVQVVNYCPNSRDAIIWYENCQLRYSNTNFFGQLNLQDSFSWHWFGLGDALYANFYNKLAILLENVISNVTTEHLMFATGEIRYTDRQTLYGLAQCTRDTSPADCTKCLHEIIAITQIQSTCNNSTGCEIVTGSCRVRAEPKKPVFIGIAISVSIVVLITCVVCLLYFCYWRKEISLQEQALSREDAMDGPTDANEQDGRTAFNLATIQSATNDFAEANYLGRGGFGVVYKGQLPDGQKIAVKRLSGNGDYHRQQFDNEVQTLTRVQHRNLVRLLGGFQEGPESILIYEFVPNGSLDEFLFGEPTNRTKLDWSVRSKLINGISRGLRYLHEDCRLKIVHRDLKAGNVLLDEDMNPKISDFGTAKIFHTRQTHVETSTVIGTYGYMAPAYSKEGMVSVKTDVLSFGVLLLEIISGKRSPPSNQHDTDESLLNHERVVEHFVFSTRISFMTGSFQ